MSDLERVVGEALGKLGDGRHGVVVAAVAGDETVVRGTAGLDAGSRFEIGSISKVFTALALARLTVAGVTALDEPLRDLLPPGSATPSRDGHQITLRHLATHTAGLPRLPPGMLWDALLRPNKPDPYAHCTEAWLLAALGRTRLKARPGQRFGYSNYGAGLLGMALARRAGTDYDSLIAREIGAPFGLADTSVHGATIPGHNRRGRQVAPWHLADLAGAGGLRSTAADLIAFLRAHLAPAPDPAIALLRETEHRVNPFLRMRLGWMEQRLHPKQGGHLQVFHTGGTGGFSSFAGFDPEKRVGLVVLSDTQSPVDRPALAALTALQERCPAV